MAFRSLKKVAAVAAVLAVIGGGAVAGVALNGGNPSSIESARGQTSAVLRNLDFDTCNASQWGGTQARPGRITYPNSGTPTPRQGNGRCMARFEVRSGDDPINSGGERAEVLTSAASVGSTQGLDRWYGFSVFIPTSNPALTSGFNIFAQWHSPGGSGQSSIIMDLGGTIRLYGGCNSTNAGASCGQGSINVGAHPRGRWVDWLLHVNWSSSATGRLTVLRDGNQVWADSGPNLYTNGGSYLKVGLYRGGGSTFVIYQDSWKVGTSRAAVEGSDAPIPPPAPPPTPPPSPPPAPPPAVVVTQTISSGEVLSGTANWQATVTGCSPRPTKVEFFVDGTLALTEINAPFGDTVGFWNTSTVPNGQHSFQIRATCPSGSQGNASTTATVANEAPEPPPAPPAPPPPPPPDVTLEERVTALEERVTALEAGP